MSLVPNAGVRCRRETLAVHLLGLVDFESVLELQQRMLDEVAASGGRKGILFLCEHPPVITMGREASVTQLECTPEEQASRQLAVHWLSRGGGCFVHTPGQLAIYPVVDVNAGGSHAVQTMQQCETAVLESCLESEVLAWTDSREPGVWCRGGQLACTGLRVHDGITQYGLFLNVAPNMDLVRLAHPVMAARLTSLSAERQQLVPMAGVRERVMRHLSRQLGFDHYHLFTGHPLLRRTRRIVAYA